MRALEQVAFRFIFSCENIEKFLAAGFVLVVDKLEVVHSNVVCLATVSVETTFRQ